MVTFTNFPLLWVLKLQTDISLYTLNSDYVAFSNSVRDLLPLETLVKEMVENLGMNSEKLDFVSISTIY